VVPKHRRSEIEPSLASVYAPANTSEFWTDPRGDTGQDWEVWQDWGPPPALHPDHPSAPVPRVQLPDDDYDRGNRRPHPVPARRDHAGYLRHPGPGWQQATDHRREAGPPGPFRGPATGRLPGGHFPNRDSLWTAGQVIALAEGRAVQIADEAQDYAAAIRQVAEREAAAITQQAAGQAADIRDAAERETAAMREAAEREAAAIARRAAGQAAEIREAAERDAADLRARLDSMSGELGRMAAYVTDTLGVPSMPAAAPSMPATAPALPRSAPPGTSPPLPDVRPAGPAKAAPAETATAPAKPSAAPAKPAAGPARKPPRPGRQQQAMRVATAATAALTLFAVGTGAAEISAHGLKFFVFREQGQGQSTDGPSDQQFLARQAAATHSAVTPKGRHHSKPHDTLEVHHN
jgi:hypothetical protein